MLVTGSPADIAALTSDACWVHAEHLAAQSCLAAFRGLAKRWSKQHPAGLRWSAGHARDTLKISTRANKSLAGSCKRAYVRAAGCSYVGDRRNINAIPLIGLQSFKQLLAGSHERHDHHISGSGAGCLLRMSRFLINSSHFGDKVVREECQLVWRLGRSRREFVPSNEQRSRDHECVERKRSRSFTACLISTRQYGRRGDPCSKFQLRSAPQ